MILDNVATPDISQSDTYIVNSTIPITNLLNGNPDDIRYFIFGLDAIFESNSDINLQGSKSFTGQTGDTLTLIFDGTNWLELSRSLNPLYVGGDLSNYTMDIGYITQELANIKMNLNIIQKQIDMTGVTYNDTTLTLYPGMTNVEIQGGIDGTYSNITKNSNLIIEFVDGTYGLSEPIVFRNFRGDGNIYIKSSSVDELSNSKNVVLNSSVSKKGIFQFVNCDIPIHVNGFKMVTDIINSSTNGVIEIINSNTVNISYNYFDSNTVIADNIYGIDSRFKSAYNYFDSGKACIHADGLSHSSVSENSVFSEQPKYGIISSNGAIISMINSQNINGSISDTHTYGGGVINA